MRSSDPAGVSANQEALSRPGRAAALVIAGLLLVLTAVEVAVRSEVDALRLPVSGLQRKIRWLATRPRPDLLVLGDSTAHRGIDASRLGATALNGAYTSESPIVMRAVLDGLPWQGKQVVVGMFPLLLNDGWPSEPHEAAVASLRERVSLMGWGEGLLGALWRTYENRRVLKEVRNTTLLRLGGGAAPTPPAEVDDASGSLPIVLEGKPTEAAARALLDKWLANGEPRLGVRAAALRDLHRRLTEQGVKVTYVWMPISSDLRAAIAARRLGDFGARALEESVHPTAGEVLDCRESLPDEAFYDPDHLREGPWRERFSVALGRAILARSSACPRLE